MIEAIRACMIQVNKQIKDVEGDYYAMTERGNNGDYHIILNALDSQFELLENIYRNECKDNE